MGVFMITLDKKTPFMIIIGILITGFLIAIKLTASAISSKQAIKGIVEEEIRIREAKLSQLGQQIKALSSEKNIYAQKEAMLEEKLSRFQDDIKNKTEREKFLGSMVQELEEEKQLLAQALSETNETLQKELRISEREAEQELERRKKESVEAEKNAVIEITVLKRELENLNREKERLKKMTAELVDELDITREKMSCEKKQQAATAGSGSELEKELPDGKVFREHYNRGLKCDDMGEYEQALEEYQKALEILPEDPDLHYNMAIVYDDHMDDKQKAVFHYQRYLELNPGAADRAKVRTWLSAAKEELAWRKKFN
jgi:tetratricopeptide (TPR) repeat protein